MDKPIRRALVSVFDKEGVVDFCRRLTEARVSILSSGGTARLLQESGIEVTPVSEYTGFPEMLDGRVKTLHPKIHAGLLAVRANEKHMADLDEAGIDPIDLVVVNLYPFEKTAATDGIGLADVIEMIDIGGPTMVRAAAKNHASVGVVVDPSDYARVADEIRDHGTLSGETRLGLAVSAFRHTASYDTAVHGYLSRVDSDGTLRESDGMPAKLQVEYGKAQDLRYGENPHQKAAFYRDPLCTTPSVCSAQQLQGKELSFNNILDFDAALGLAAELDAPSCVIIKHGNPCGAARAQDILSAFQRALECDPLSAFGGVVAFNRAVDRPTAEAMAGHFFEGIIAPEFDAGARERLAKKKKWRLLETGDLERFARTGWDLRRVCGGMLAQDWDAIDENVRESKVVSKRQPTAEEWSSLEFAWTVCKNVKSNAIVYVKDDRTLGVGAGQMSRVDSARIAVQKAQSPLEGSVMASDAFFPFRDGIDAAAEAGIKAVVQPGGSIRDEEVIAAADEHDIAMVFTGRRHFRH